MSKPDPITEAEWAAMCDELEALGHRDPGAVSSALILRAAAGAAE
mgnify:CR=1 FL=1